MEKKRIIIVLLFTLFLAMASTMGFLVYSNLKLQKEIKEQISSSKGNKDAPASDGISVPKTPGNMPENSDTPQSMLFTEEKDIPQAIYGEIDSVSSDKITLRQLASIEIKYEIKKENIQQITLIKKNPNYDEKKGQELSRQAMESLKEGAPGNSPNIPQFSGKESNDPNLNPVIEEKSSWNVLEKGLTANLTTNKDGKRELRVYSKELSEEMKEKMPKSF